MKHDGCLRTNVLPHVRTMVCVFAIASFVSGTADAAVTVFGSTLGSQCYKAAEKHSGVRTGLAICNRALTDDDLVVRDRAATLVNRGILKLLSDDRAGALADYAAAIRLQPDMGDAYVNRGLLYLREGGKDELALAEMTKGLELGTSDAAAAYFGRAFAYESLGRIAEAYQDFKHAAELKPEWNAPKKQLARFAVKTKE